jgi:hypothetical protein
MKLAPRVLRQRERPITMTSIASAAAPSPVVGGAAPTHAAKAGGGKHAGAFGSALSSASSADVTTVVTNADGSVTTTVTDATGKTLSTATTAAAKASSALYASNGKVRLA